MVAEWECLAAGVDEDAGAEALVGAVAELGERAPIARVERSTRLDLDRGDLAGAVLEDDVDLVAPVTTRCSLGVWTSCAPSPGRQAGSRLTRKTVSSSWV